VTTAGTYRVTVTVSDSSNPQSSGTMTFPWLVDSGRCWGELRDHRALTIPDVGTVYGDYYNGCDGNASASASVSLDVTHGRVGDLVIDLIAPSGRAYNLTNRAGGGATSLVKTYSLNLSGERREGTWRLRIQDAAAGNSGKLNEVTLTL
jgi:hypothetical protein